MSDFVNHPPHYSSDPSGVECIQITRHRNFNIGNAIKYLWRAGIKDEAKHAEDLRKAVFYIQDEIARLTGTSRENASTAVFTANEKDTLSRALYAFSKQFLVSKEITADIEGLRKKIDRLPTKDEWFASLRSENDPK